MLKRRIAQTSAQGNEMTDIQELQLYDIRRDFLLRGYSEDEIGRILKTPILLVPGIITPHDTDTPTQKLTPQIAYTSKYLNSKEITNQVVLLKDTPKQYIEERHAHIDLGTIIISLTAFQQLETYANIAQILDFLFNFIHLNFSQGRTKELMPNVKFDLDIHDGEKAVNWHIEGPADSITQMSTPKHIETLVSFFKETSDNGEK